MTFPSAQVRWEVGSAFTDGSSQPGPIPSPSGSGAARPCRPGTDDLPRLELVQGWRSRRPRPRESITLVTQLSSDRLEMLENQCLTWPDPIVAAVHLPLARAPGGGVGPPGVPSHFNTTLRDVLRGADAFHVTMEGLGACALHMLLLGQFTDESDPEPYPINALRNRALAEVRTELVLLLDVDFVVSLAL
jgi:hypothetical protein